MTMSQFETFFVVVVCDNPQHISHCWWRLPVELHLARGVALVVRGIEAEEKLSGTVVGPVV